MSKHPNRFTPAALQASLEARQARADERAANVAPLIAALQAAGVTKLQGIAAALNERGVPTPSGHRHWRPMQVSRLLKRLPVECRTMHPFKKKPQMTSEEFKTALREAGLGVAQGWIVDVSGKCPGFASLPSFNKGVLNRNATLSKVHWEREAEIARRAKEEG